MLLKFTIKNYKSYKIETVFDFTETPLTAYTTGLVVGDVATGKSNFIDALGFAVNCVTQRFQTAPSGNDGYLAESSLRNEPFINNGIPADNGVSTFSMQFTIPHAFKDINPFGKGDMDTRVYEYNFTVTPESIISESLYFYNIGDDNKLLKKNRVMVFEREYGKKLKVNKDIIGKSHVGVFDMCRGNVVSDEIARKHDGGFILHDGAHMKCAILEYVYKFFDNFDICTFSDANVRRFLTTTLPEYLESRPDTCMEYAKMLRSMTNDNTIAGISVNNVDGERRLYIVHDPPFACKVTSESDGVQKALTLVHVLKFAELYGGVVAIDDFDKHADSHVCMYACIYAQAHGIQIIGTTASPEIGVCCTTWVTGMDGAWINVSKNDGGISVAARK